MATANNAATPKPPSIADECCSRAHRIAERAHDIASDLENKLAPYSHPVSDADNSKCDPRETYPVYFTGLRVALDNMEAALDRIVSANSRAQL